MSLEPMFAEPVTEWHRWFAWRPVMTWDEGWKWLRFVYRRRCQPHSYLPGAHTWFWQHAAHPIFTNTKEERDD